MESTKKLPENPTFFECFGDLAAELDAVDLTNNEKKLGLPPTETVVNLGPLGKMPELGQRLLILQKCYNDRIQTLYVQAQNITDLDFLETMNTELNTLNLKAEMLLNMCWFVTNACLQIWDKNFVVGAGFEILEVTPPSSSDD